MTMNFLPAVPNVQQQTYGQGYGNWQQYGGYGSSNPFGGGQGAGVQPNATNPVKPPSSPSEPVHSFSDWAKQELNNIGNNISTNVGKITNAFNLATSGQGYDAIQALNGNYKSQVGNATGTEPVQGQ